MSESVIRNKKVVRIDGKHFNRMLEVGDVSLVAVYAELKAFRNSEERYVPYKNKSNNKITTGYSLLNKCSGISIPTLKKYVPMLIDLGLCYFDPNNGALHINGYKKIKISKSGKLVPVKILSSFAETRASVQYVLLNSNRDAQIKAVVKKQTLKDKLKLSQNKSGIITKSDYRKIENLRKEGIFKPSDIKVVKDVILSNQGFAILLSKGSNNKSTGYYIKKKLVNLGYIKTRRRFKDILGKQTSFEDYLNWKYMARKAGEDVDHITWRKGRVVLELVSSINFEGKTNDFSYTSNTTTNIVCSSISPKNPLV